MNNIMKKLIALLLLLSTLLITACDGVYHEGEAPGGNEGEGEGSTPGGGTETEDPFTVYVRWFNPTYKEYEPYVQDEPLTVQWTNGYDYYTATLGEDSKAQVTGLDGDYNVTLQGLDTTYAYNSNAYIATNYEKDVVIDVYTVRPVSTRGGKGGGLYNCIGLSELAVYSASIKSSTSTIYFEFEPKVAGTYSVESWVDVTASEYNPYIDVYTGTFAAKYLSHTLDDGGISSGFTQNFRYVVEISDDMIGNVFTFAVRCASKNDLYPANVNFAIQLDGGFTGQNYEKQLITPDEELADTYDYLRGLGAMEYSEFASFAHSITGYDSTSYGGLFDLHMLPKTYELLSSITFPTWNAQNLRFEIDGASVNHKTLYELMQLSSRYFAVDAYVEAYENGGAAFDALNENYAKGMIYYLVKCRFNNSGTITYADSSYSVNVSGTNRRVFDGSKFKYWAKADGGDGFYHYYDEEVYAATGGYGPILYAAISTANRYTDLPFNHIEDPGNASLTVNKIYNHKLYIQGFADLIIDPPALEVGPYLCTSDCYCRESGTCVGACMLGCDRCGSYCRNVDDSGMYALGLVELSNSQGYYPVTQTLKDFLQAFCISQRYFADGNGWVETNEDYPVYALEDDQWLFACVYYLP